MNLFVGLSIHVFLSHQKSQLYEILPLGLIWARLGHDEARFKKIVFKGGPHMVQC